MKACAQILKINVQVRYLFTRFGWLREGSYARLNQPRVFSSRSIPMRPRMCFQAQRPSRPSQPRAFACHTSIQAQVNPHSVSARVKVRTLVGWSTLGSTAKQNRKVYYQTSNGAISLFFPGGGVGFCNSARLRFDRVGSGFAFLCDRVRIPRGI